MRRNIVDWLHLRPHAVVRRCFKACQHHQAGGFARTGRPQHCQKLAGGNKVQIQVFDDKRFAIIAFLHTFEADKGLSCLAIPCLPSHSVFNRV